VAEFGGDWYESEKGLEEWKFEFVGLAEEGGVRGPLAWLLRLLFLEVLPLRCLL
jgi:hypothetical protein